MYDASDPSKGKDEKLAVLSLRSLHVTVISRRCFAEYNKKMYNFFITHVHSHCSVY